jgi:hypothetical protein
MPQDQVSFASYREETFGLYAIDEQQFRLLMSSRAMLALGRSLRSRQLLDTFEQPGSGLGPSHLNSH